MDTAESKFGMERGKVFPATHARSLLHPVRRVLQSPRRTAAWMSLVPNCRVLEIGSGPGYFSPHIAEAVHDGRLVVMDLQGEMVQLARRRLVRRTNVSFVQADGSRLPFPIGCFDAVLIAVVLGEIPDHASLLADVRRVLRAGGVVNIAETVRDGDFIPFPNLKDLLELHSFSLVGKRGTRWQYLARFEAR